MNKTTYANFYGVVNVFLGGDCVNSALNVFGRGMFIEDGPPYSFTIMLHRVILQLGIECPV